jgi:1,4-dihydroxy-2-naphthoate octaprenyltransferase
MTAVSVTVGSLMALRLQGKFDLVLYLLTLIAMIAVHGATNLINDYFDVRHGVDRPESPTAQYRPHPLLLGTFSARQILISALSLYAVAALIGLYFAGLRGWSIVALALAGGLTSLFYTADPIKYKHYALGEPAVFLMWGPLMVGGTYYVQTGSWEAIASVLLVSIPIGLFVAAVLLANNLKDIDYDAQVTVRTLGNLFGLRWGRRLFEALVLIIYASIMALAMARLLPLWTLIILLSLPKVRTLFRNFSGGEIPVDADPQTAQLALVFGLLLIAGLILGHFWPTA